MSKLLILTSDIFTNDESRPLIKSGGIVIGDGGILDIGDTDDLKRKYPDAVEENLGDGLLTPGLVNLHHHLYSSLARGWNPGSSPPENFPQVLDKIWWKLDRALTLDDIYYSAIVGLCESVRMGVTSVIDHHASQNNVTGSLDSIARAFKEIGLRGSVCFEITDRAGKGIFQSGLKETIEALGKWPEHSKNNHLTAMVGLHASMTLSDDSLKKISGTTREYKPGYHFHLAEDKSDQEDALAKYGMRATERFAKHNMLGSKSLAIHGVHLSDDEIKLLRKSDTNLVLCPRSNQNNGVGFPKWRNYHGVNIGLGTDGIGSDIISEAKSALYLTHHDYGKPDFGFNEIINMLLINNPSIFEKVTGCKTGRLSIGYPADFVFRRYNSPTPIDENNVGGHYLYGLYNHQADSVWINGEKILANGEFLKLDFGKMIAKARELAKKLWERI